MCKSAYPEESQFDDKETIEPALILGHEILNSLAALDGLTEKLALERALQPCEIEQFRSTIHYLQLVGETALGRTAQAEAGRMETRTFAPADLVATAATAFHALAEQAGSTLSVNLALPAGLRLRGDGGRINLIVGNLLSNAVKHAPRATIYLEARLENEAQPEELQLVVEVRDSGPGLPQSIWRRAFAQRSGGLQANRHIGRLPAGRAGGIGLPLLRDCCRSMGAEIQCRSRKGHGTLLRVWIPVQIASERDSGPVSLVAEDCFCLTDLPLLVIEDNPILQEVFSAHLKRWGFACEVEGDGWQGLQAALHKRYAAILVDSQLPGLSGMELVHRLRTEERVHPSTLIFGTTAHADAHMLSAWLRSGLDGVFRKTMATEDLRNLLAPLMGTLAEDAVNEEALLFEMANSGEWQRLRGVWISTLQTYSVQFEAALRDPCSALAHHAGHQLLGHLKALLICRASDELEAFLMANRNGNAAECRRRAVACLCRIPHLCSLVEHHVWRASA